MRILFVVIGLVLGLAVNGQLILKPIKKNKSETRAYKVNRTAGKTTLPFWDDFSIRNDSPDSIRIWGSDTTRQWNYELSKNVFVNTTLAVNPPSYGVATLDGLDENGAFHGDGVGLTDQLVSDTIDLTGEADVVLSFYWQAGGNVELPEPGDSLSLQFYSPNDTVGTGWSTVWNMDGGDLLSDQDSVFTQEGIPVPIRFLTDRFLFRFQSYGDQDGPFDAWHIDWIYMNSRRGADDFFYDGEVSLNSEISLLFSPFKSIPIHQISSPDFITEASISSMNLNPEPDNIGLAVNYLFNVTETDSGNEITSSSTLNPDLRTFFNPEAFRVTMQNPLTFEGLAFQDLQGQDSVVLEATVNTESTTTVDFLDNTNINLRINDTVRTRYLLHDYYAYDDGTAEYAAGTNINGAQVAVQFWLNEPDTLTHIDIQLPNIDPTSAGSALTLQIHKRLAEEPIRTQSVNVINGTTINEFTRYELNTPIIVADTFFIGYRQSRNDYLGIGFDRSNPAASEYIYENRSGQWEQNTRLVGALMIRPVFKAIDSLVLSSPVPRKQLVVYPNPTSGLLKIDGEYEAISISDFSGRVWYQVEASPEYDISSLRSGLYLLTIHRKEGDQTLKIIKK